MLDNVDVISPNVPSLSIEDPSNMKNPIADVITFLICPK